MIASTCRSAWLGPTLACLIACGMVAGEADAQVNTQPGEAILPLVLYTHPGVAAIYFYAPVNFRDAMNSAGGVTLFAASAPNGPLFVRLPFLAPFPPPPDDTDNDYGWYFPGVPPGTYYVAVILGVVDTPNIAPQHWTRLVVPGACTSAPGMGTVSRDLAGGVADSVRLFLGASGGCATGYRIEVGTSPGTANVASIQQAGVLLSADAVPSGSYYVRVTGINQFGPGRSSEVLPVAVPDCSATVPVEESLNFGSTVVGHQVTLTWTPPVTPPGRPVTYYEIALLNTGTVHEPNPRILLPTTASSFSTSVPSGTYAIGLHPGNACGSWMGGSLTFTVP